MNAANQAPQPSPGVQHGASSASLAPRGRTMKGKLLVIVAGAGFVLTIIGIVVSGAFCSPTFESRFNYNHIDLASPTTPVLSPDGTTILCDAFGEDKGRIIKILRKDHTVVPISNAAGRDPEFSPDGKKIALSRETGGYLHIWMMDANGSNQVQVTHGRVIDRMLSFSSTGETIYFVRCSWCGRALLPEREIFGVSTASSAAAIRIGPGRSISPDGRIILFEKENSDGKSEVWSRDVRVAATKRLALGDSPRFSPDASKIVFLRQRPDYRHELWVMASDGTKQTMVAAPEGYKSQPRFCLDASAVMFRIESSPRDGPGGIYMISLAANHQERFELR